MSEQEQGSLFSLPVLQGDDALKAPRDRAMMCQKCVLHKTRTQVVYGVGNFRNPPIAFVGEAPGKNEDKQGEPFVGDAGKILNGMIETLGFTREQIYICNSVNCRPPENRKPTPDEMAACKEHLVTQLRIVQPKVIVALGVTAGQQVTGTKKQAMKELRGRWYEWEGILVRSTYHPAYLLREPSKKKDVWEDLQLVLRRIQAMTP
jgi:uracil-DNA glycosylase